MDMDNRDFELWADALAHALGSSRKLQARYCGSETVIHAVPSTTSGEEWRKLIERLNAIDPDGGWGRLRIGQVEFVAVKGTTEIPGAVWV
jgi:hypothetical protein